ncbi:helix-turn-helix transcriptional regulator [Spirillospora albida]|uniref:helix-turn-helix transcriptional regulator n=1 Tax=Spirillospora albida TaxID=58123 RepID=UPI0004C01AC2|nr:LuxR family transcriptional regulator [Spirillospora albida]
MIYGRDTERARISGLLAGARDRRSGALVLRGEAGIGKSALLSWAASTVPDACVLRATGFEAERDIPFAGLLHLLWPVRDRLDAVPGPQAAALRAALGMDGAPGPDRFLTGLAVLSLLAELAEDGPVLCLVDDAQWLGSASVEALLFAARRLAAEGVVMLFAARDDGFPATGLPELHLPRLGDDEAGRLLADRSIAPFARHRIILEADGNPLALIEFGAAGARHPSGSVPLPVADRVVASFQAQIDRLPESTRLMLLIAAAEGRGWLPSLLGAAGELGVGLPDLAEAERAGLVEVSGTAIAFRHPLVRAAAYQGAATARRVAVHHALARSSDDSGCRARHRAAATLAPDEGVAADLQAAAEEALHCHGYATAASLYRQAADLTPDPDARARRLGAAAAAILRTGNTGEADELARQAERLTADAGEHARLARVRATVEYERGEPRRAARMLLERAPDSAPDDAPAMLRAAATYAWTSGDAASVVRAAALLREAGHPHEALDGMALVVQGDYARGLPALAESSGDSPEDRLATALMLGDDDAVLELAAVEAAHLRENGLIGALPTVLKALARAQIAAGLHRDAEATVAEATAIARDTGFERRAVRLGAGLARLAAIEGDEERVHALIADAPGGGQADAALGLLDLGLGRYEHAHRRLDETVRGPRRHTPEVMLATADLVEAAVRGGAPGRAVEPLERFRSWSEAGGLPWARAVALRCQALLDDAEEPYVQAMALHEKGGRPFERARTELLYGEWLRRARRRSDARAPLHSALKIFDGLRAAPWSERARAELRATGETRTAAAPTASDVLDRLTPQELQVVRLAADGVSSRDIAARLFLSPRTVEYHLYKAYPKLGVSSRKELAALTLTRV